MSASLLSVSCNVSVAVIPAATVSIFPTAAKTRELSPPELLSLRLLTARSCWCWSTAAYCRCCSASNWSRCSASRWWRSSCCSPFKRRGSCCSPFNRRGSCCSPFTRRAWTVVASPLTRRISPLLCRALVVVSPLSRISPLLRSRSCSPFSCSCCRNIWSRRNHELNEFLI